MFVFCLLITYAIHVNAYEKKNGIQNVKDYIFDRELHKIPVERQIFSLKKNGVKVDLKIVPWAKNDSVQNKDVDYFPKFPIRDIGNCIIEFSFGCIKKRFVRFLETVGRLDEITLLGQDVKLVKSGAARKSDARSMNDSDINIERSIDDFFNSFTLRIMLPRWNNKRERNQIDVAYDEIAVAEGRKKSGSGGGGGGKGGKCKMMMMGMFMMIKMKLIGLAALKSLMMGGMSLMLSMMMFKGKGGAPWKGGGDTYKEIVLLTKASGGGGHSDGGHGYAPPPSSYGPSSGGGGGGGGGYGGGGGWGRSFHKWPMVYDKETKTEITDGSNRIPMTGETISNTGNINYLGYQELSSDYQEPSSSTNSSSIISNWNTPSYTTFQYKDTNVNSGLTKNNSKSEAAVNAKGRSFIFDENPINPINIVNVIEKNVDSMTTTDQPVADVTHEFTTNAVYMDEWQATAEKTNSHDVLSTNSNADIELQQTELRSKDIPLLREI